MGVDMAELGLLMLPTAWCAWGCKGGLGELNIGLTDRLETCGGGAGKGPGGRYAGCPGRAG